MVPPLKESYHVLAHTDFNKLWFLVAKLFLPISTSRAVKLG